MNFIYDDSDITTNESLLDQLHDFVHGFVVDQKPPRISIMLFFGPDTFLLLEVFAYFLYPGCMDGVVGSYDNDGIFLQTVHECHGRNGFATPCTRTIEIAI